jgi:hypothetical protein
MRPQEIRDIVEKAKASGLITGPGQKVMVKTAGAEAATFGNVRVSFEMITPAVARHWLNNNQGNRRLRSSTVDSYARDMRAGQWVTNHQGLAFNANDQLIDGQHRLHAIVAADTTVLLMVSRGWPVQETGKRVRTMDTVDVGAGRSLADLLHLQHGSENPRVVTASARIIVEIAARLKRGAGKMSMSTLLLVASEYAAGMKFMAANVPRHKGLRVAAVLGVLVMAYEHAPEQVTNFCRRLIDGVGLLEGSPALTLRNYLLSGGHKKETRINVNASIIALAVQCWVKNKTMSHPRGSDEALDWLRSLKPESAAKIAALWK